MPIKLWFLSRWEAIYFEGLRLAALTRSASLPACPFEEREGRAGWAAQFSLRYCRLKAYRQRCHPAQTRLRFLHVKEPRALAPARPETRSVRNESSLQAALSSWERDMRIYSSQKSLIITRVTN